MPNVHIRGLPPEVVETLREAAKHNGRSLNAELVAVLVGHAASVRDREDATARLERVRTSWRERNPDGYPAGLEPETIIREYRDRDAHA